MSSSSFDDLGKLILRVGVGVLLLLHGIAKINHGVDGLVSMVAAQGLPSFVAYGVYVGEVLAPVLIIAGIYTRIGGLLAVINMLFALGLAHMPQLFSLGKTGGWALELQGLYLLGGLAIMLLGAGAYSIGGRAGRFN